MPRSQQTERSYPFKLTQAQRRVVAEIAPDLADRLKLDETAQRTIPFALDELKMVQNEATVRVQHAKTGIIRNSLLHVIDLATQAIDGSQGIGAIPVSERLYQFRITLQQSHPSIWRRIQVKECTLDKLHERIQTAMGWTNSHLNHFRIGKQLYGDPMLMREDFGELNYEDSTTTKLSNILPKTGQRFQFGYEYDFGDCWHHDVLFEGCVPTEPGRRYPVCIEGSRACPPEDVGGVPGYAEFLKAIQDPDHERHEEFLQWVGGHFDSDDFDAAIATKKMHRGLPDWRRLSAEVW